MLEDLYQNLLEQVSEAASWAVNIRREFHRWPEAGNEEYRTAERIKEELANIGVEVKQLLDTGLKGIIRGESLSAKKKGIAFRADIDGLKIQEKTGLPFASERDGYMHACGHDVHTAVLLGAARVLNNMRKKLTCDITLIFQPAEETSGGAERMIDAGCLKEPDIHIIYGLHVKPELRAGLIGYRYGSVHASSDHFKIRVKGKSAHGASPHKGVDALLAGCQIVINLQTIISRSIDPLVPAVISTGSFHSGYSVNIISDEAVIQGTIRTFDPDQRELLQVLVEKKARLTAEALGASALVEFTPGYDALYNETEAVNRLRKVAGLLLGEENVTELKNPTLGVEDFTYYLKHVPGAFFFLGSGYPEKDNPPIHSDLFNVNEDCVKTGILVLCGLTLMFGHIKVGTWDKI